MKLLKLGASLFVVVLLSFTAISCSGKKTDDGSKETHMKGEEAHDHEHNEPAKQEMHVSKMDNSAMSSEKSNKSKLVVASYLQLKNALAADDNKEAAIAGEVLFKSLKGFDTSGFSKEDQKELDEIIEDASEQAEHISDSPIDHQREHFVTLSEDIRDLIVIAGSEKKLYQDFCPMANDGKGAIWLSEVKEIKNPFMGSKMPTCGSVQKEI